VCYGTATWPDAACLDHAAGYFFRRRGGGGDTVIHRLLQDDFAARNTVSGHGAYEEASREGGPHLGCSVSQVGRSWTESRL
jgi:hypothetical protein